MLLYWFVVAQRAVHTQYRPVYSGNVVSFIWIRLADRNFRLLIASTLTYLFLPTGKQRYSNSNSFEGKNNVSLLGRNRGSSGRFQFAGNTSIQAA
jgi:hypothetical protein